MMAKSKQSEAKKKYDKLVKKYGKKKVDNFCNAVQKTAKLFISEGFSKI